MKQWDRKMGGKFVAERIGPTSICGSKWLHVLDAITGLAVIYRVCHHVNSSLYAFQNILGGGFMDA